MILGDLKLKANITRNSNYLITQNPKIVIFVGRFVYLIKIFYHFGI